MPGIGKLIVGGMSALTVVRIKLDSKKKKVSNKEEIIEVASNRRRKANGEDKTRFIRLKILIKLIYWRSPEKLAIS
jgi:hypothetical protein